jgi:hypothetical protein
MQQPPTLLFWQRICCGFRVVDLDALETDQNIKRGRTYVCAPTMGENYWIFKTARLVPG